MRIITSTHRCDVRETDDGTVTGRVSGRKDEVGEATKNEERRVGVLPRVQGIEV